VIWGVATPQQNPVLSHSIMHMTVVQVSGSMTTKPEPKEDSPMPPGATDSASGAASFGSKTMFYSAQLMEVVSSKELHTRFLTTAAHRLHNTVDEAHRRLSEGSILNRRHLSIQDGEHVYEFKKSSPQADMSIHAERVPNYLSDFVNSVKQGDIGFQYFKDCFEKHHLSQDAPNDATGSEAEHTPALCALQLVQALKVSPDLHLETVTAVKHHAQGADTKSLPLSDRQFSSFASALGAVGGCIEQTHLMDSLQAVRRHSSESTDKLRSAIITSLMQTSEPCESTLLSVYSMIEAATEDWYSRSQLLLLLSSLAEDLPVDDHHRARVLAVLDDEWTVTHTLFQLSEQNWNSFMELARKEFDTMPESEQHNMLLAAQHWPSKHAGQEAWEHASAAVRTEWHEKLIDSMAHELKAAADDSLVTESIVASANKACSSLEGVSRSACQDSIARRMQEQEHSVLPAQSHGPMFGRRHLSQEQQFKLALPGFGQAASNLAMLLHAYGNLRDSDRLDRVAAFLNHPRRHLRQHSLAILENWPSAIEAHLDGIVAFACDDTEHYAVRLGAMASLHHLEGKDLSETHLVQLTELFEARHLVDWDRCVEACASKCVHRDSERCEPACGSSCEAEFALYRGAALSLHKHLSRPESEDDLWSPEIPASVPIPTLGLHMQVHGQFTNSRALDVLFRDGNMQPRPRRLFDLLNKIFEVLNPSYTKLFFRFGDTKKWEYLIGAKMAGVYMGVILRNHLTLSAGLFGGYFEIDIYNTARLSVWLLGLEINIFDAKLAVNFGFEFLGIIPRDLLEKFNSVASTVISKVKSIGERGIELAEKVKGVLETGVEYFDIIDNTLTSALAGVNAFVAMMESTRQLTTGLKGFATKSRSLITALPRIQYAEDDLQVLSESIDRFSSDQSSSLYSSSFTQLQETVQELMSTNVELGLLKEDFEKYVESTEQPGHPMQGETRFERLVAGLGDSISKIKSLSSEMQASVSQVSKLSLSGASEVLKLTDADWQAFQQTASSSAAAVSSAVASLRALQTAASAGTMADLEVNAPAALRGALAAKFQHQARKLGGGMATGSHLNATGNLLELLKFHLESSVSSAKDAAAAQNFVRSRVESLAGFIRAIQSSFSTRDGTVASHLKNITWHKHIHAMEEDVQLALVDWSHSTVSTDDFRAQVQEAMRAVQQSAYVSVQNTLEQQEFQLVKLLKAGRQSTLRTHLQSLRVQLDTSRNHGKWKQARQLNATLEVLVHEITQSMSQAALIDARAHLSSLLMELSEAQLLITNGTSLSALSALNRARLQTISSVATDSIRQGVTSISSCQSAIAASATSLTSRADELRRLWQASSSLAAETKAAVKLSVMSSIERSELDVELCEEQIVECFDASAVWVTRNALHRAFTRSQDSFYTGSDSIASNPDKLDTFLSTEAAEVRTLLQAGKLRYSWLADANLPNLLFTNGAACTSRDLSGQALDRLVVLHSHCASDTNDSEWRLGSLWSCIILERELSALPCSTPSPIESQHGSDFRTANLVKWMAGLQIARGFATLNSTNIISAATFASAQQESTPNWPGEFPPKFTPDSLSVQELNNWVEMTAFKEISAIAADWPQVNGTLPVWDYPSSCALQMATATHAAKKLIFQSRLVEALDSVLTRSQQASESQAPLSEAIAAARDVQHSWNTSSSTTETTFTSTNALAFCQVQLLRFRASVEGIYALQDYTQGMVLWTNASFLGAVKASLLSQQGTQLGSNLANCLPFSSISEQTLANQQLSSQVEHFSTIQSAISQIFSYRHVFKSALKVLDQPTSGGVQNTADDMRGAVNLLAASLPNLPQAQGVHDWVQSLQAIIEASAKNLLAVSYLEPYLRGV